MSDELDRTDRALLLLLQRDAHASFKQIADMVGLAASTVYERVRRLRRLGVLRGIHADVDPRAMGVEMKTSALPSRMKNAVEPNSPSLQMTSPLRNRRLTTAPGFLSRIDFDRPSALCCRLAWVLPALLALDFEPDFDLALDLSLAMAIPSESGVKTWRAMPAMCRQCARHI